MNGRFDTSQVTEEEFESLSDEDGVLRDDSQESDEETEEVEEDADQEQDDETEDSEEEPQGDDSEEINWDEVDPRYKAHFEKTAAEAKKWQESHSKIQSQWTKASQAQKQFATERDRYVARDKQLSEIEELLEKHPGLVDLIDKEVAKAANPAEAEDVPEYLRQDPAYQHMQKIHAQIQKELQEVKKKTSRFDDMDKQAAETKNKEALDTQLKSAGEKIKSMLGREATEDDITRVLEFMVEKKMYDDGELAALAVFKGDYEKSVQGKAQARLKEKASKFPSRQRSVSPSRVQTDGNQDLDSSIMAAIRDARDN